MIETRNINKTYGHGDATIYALKDMDMSIKQGEFVAIMGRSGAGKSTALHLLGLLDRPTSGETSWARTDTSAAWRRRTRRITSNDNE